MGFGMYVSKNGGAFTKVRGAPHINCLVENGAGEIWACTQNYGVTSFPQMVTAS